MISNALARTLSRIAALQGHAIPVSRFEYQATIQDSLKVSDLAPETAAREVWLAVFPGGSVTQQPLLPTREDFPALWLASSPEGSTDSNASILVLRGQTTSKVVAEDENGQTIEFAHEKLNSGVTLALRSQDQGDATLREPTAIPSTARGWFFHAIFKRRRIFFEAALATLLIGLFGLAGSLYTMQVYDRVIPLKGYSTLIVLTIGVLLAVLLELLMKQVRASMVERVCKIIDQELSDVFFTKALSIRLDARPKTVGTFASQIRHFESVRTFMTSTTLMVLADIPLAILFILVIAMISGWVSLVPLLAIPLALVLGLLFKRSIRQLTSEQIRESNYKNGLLIDAIDGVESLKASGAEWKVQAKWKSLTNLLADKELSLRLLTNFSSQLTQTVHQATYVGMIAFGAYLVAEGQLTLGGLIACSIISSRALQPIAQLPAVISQWQSAVISLEALDNIMRMPDDRSSAQRLVVPLKCDGAIRAERVKFQYEPGQTVIDISSLAIRPGERIAVLGAVGSGKSTLIKLLAGLYLPSDGQIFIDDIDLFQVAPGFVREHVAYLPQDVRLFNGSLRENLTLGLPNPPDEVIMQAAKLCGLSQAIARNPKGLELMIHEGGRGLSGGQRQLVGLTRMLIAKPKILLLDEPTASMDGQLESLVMRHLFEEIPKSCSVVVSTHKVAVLKYVTRIVVIQEGRVVLDGPRDEVLNQLNNPNRPQGPDRDSINPRSIT